MSDPHIHWQHRLRELRRSDNTVARVLNCTRDQAPADTLTTLVGILVEQRNLAVKQLTEQAYLIPQRVCVGGATMVCHCPNELIPTTVLPDDAERSGYSVDVVQPMSAASATNARLSALALEFTEFREAVTRYMGESRIREAIEQYRQENEQPRRSETDT